MALMFFELGFEALEQRKGIGGGAGKAGQHPTVVQLAHLARRALDDDVAQGDLTVTANGHLPALRGLTPHADDGGAVKCFHIFSR